MHPGFIAQLEQFHAGAIDEAKQMGENLATLFEEDAQFWKLGSAYRASAITNAITQMVSADLTWRLRVITLAALYIAEKMEETHNAAQ